VFRVFPIPVPLFLSQPLKIQKMVLESYVLYCLWALDWIQCDDRPGKHASHICSVRMDASLLNLYHFYSLHIMSPDVEPETP